MPDSDQEYIEIHNVSSERCSELTSIGPGDQLQASNSTITIPIPISRTPNGLISMLSAGDSPTRVVSFRKLKNLAHKERRRKLTDTAVAFAVTESARLASLMMKHCNWYSRYH